jgi:hypothetical protein
MSVVAVVVRSRLYGYTCKISCEMSYHSSDVYCCTGLELDMRPRFCPANGWVECRCASAKVPEVVGGKLSWCARLPSVGDAMYKDLCRGQ